MLIGAKERAAVQAMFADLAGPVRLVVFTQKSRLLVPGQGDCAFCEQTVSLVNELGQLSEKLTVEVVNFHTEKAKVEEYGIARIPAIAIVGAKDYGVRYYGIPAGFEFRALLEDIVDVSKGSTDLSEESLQMAERIDTPVHIQVFVTPTCPYCPPAVRFAHKLAIASDYVTADMVEAQEFPDLARRYGVYGVPRTVINENTVIEGAVPEELAMLYVLKAIDKLTEDEAERLAATIR